MLNHCKYRLCVECGRALSDNPDYVLDTKTGDSVPICYKCAKIIPKITRFDRKELSSE